MMTPPTKLKIIAVSILAGVAIIISLFITRIANSAPPCDSQSQLMGSSGDYERETYYSEKIARDWKAESEHTLPDGSRIDVLTEDTAWEVDWSHKWAEGVGQALYYSVASNRKGGVILLTGKHPEAAEKLYYTRALTACLKADLKLITYDVSQKPQNSDTSPRRVTPEPMTPSQELEDWHRENDPIIPAGD